MQVNFVQHTAASSFFQRASKRLRVTFSLSSRPRKALALSKKKFFLMTSHSIVDSTNSYVESGKERTFASTMGQRSNLQTKTINDRPHMLLSLGLGQSDYPIVWRNRGWHFPWDPRRMQIPWLSNWGACHFRATCDVLDITQVNTKCDYVCSKHGVTYVYVYKKKTKNMIFVYINVCIYIIWTWWLIWSESHTYIYKT